MDLGKTGKAILKFLKELSKSLIVPQAKFRLVTPQAIKQNICGCGVLQEARPSVQNITQYQDARDASFVQDRRTKSTDSPAADVTTPSAKNAAR